MADVLDRWLPFRNPLEGAAERAFAFLVAWREPIAYLVLVGIDLGVMLQVRTSLGTPLGATMAILAALVVVGMALLFWRSERGAHEPLADAVKVFLLGAICASIYQDLALITGSVPAVLSIAPLALAQETIKMLPLLVFAWRHARFDRPLSGLYYGGLAGAGYALFAIVFYAATFHGLYGETMGVMALGIGLVVLVPCHVAWSAVAGHYVGLAKFHPESADVLVAKGLLSATALNLLFDLGFPLAFATSALAGSALVLGAAAVSVAYLARIVRRANASERSS